MIYQCVLANHCGGVLKERYLIDPRGTQQFNFDSYRSVIPRRRDPHTSISHFSCGFPPAPYRYPLIR
ncbi:MAG: hypothetical protein PWK00_08425 [Coxiella burnetii]|nr:hypothetical protein [Coxiella burnetii]